MPSITRSTLVGRKTSSASRKQMTSPLDMANPALKADDCPPLRLKISLDAVAKAGNPFAGVISGTIIDNNHFTVTIGLASALSMASPTNCP